MPEKGKRLTNVFCPLEFPDSPKFVALTQAPLYRSCKSLASMYFPE